MRAGFVLAREGALSVIDNAALPPVMRTGVRFGRLFERAFSRGAARGETAAAGAQPAGADLCEVRQSLATRPDIVGAELAGELALAAGQDGAVRSGAGAGAAEGGAA